MLLQLWELIYIVLPRAFLSDTFWLKITTKIIENRETLWARSLIRVKWQRNGGTGYNSKLFFCTLSFVKASLCRRKAGEKEKKKARWARWAVEPLGGDKSYLHDNGRLWQSCKSYVSTVARNFCGLTIFCVLRELIDEIRTDWFFLLGVSGSIQCTALIIFSFLLSTCNRNTYFQTTLRYAYPINVKPVIRCIPFCF